MNTTSWLAKLALVAEGLHGMYKRVAVGACVSLLASTVCAQHNNARQPTASRLQTASSSLKPADTPENCRYNARILEDAISKADAGDPWLSHAFQTLGNQHMFLGEHHKAVEDFEAAEKSARAVRSDTVFALQGVMVERRRLGDTKGAVEAADKLVKAAGGDAKFSRLSSKAILLKAQWLGESPTPENEKLVMDSYRDFLAHSDPKSKVYATYAPSILRALADKLENAGKTSEAVSVYKSFLAKYPSDNSAPYVALCVERLNAVDHSVRPDVMQSILLNYPVDSGGAAVVKYEYGLSLYGNGQYEAALQPLHSAYHFQPAQKDDSYSEVVTALSGLTLGRCYVALKRITEARVVLEEVAAKYPSFDEAKEAEMILRTLPKETAQRQKAFPFALVSLAIPIAAALGLILIRLLKRR